MTDPEVYYLTERDVDRLAAQALLGRFRSEKCRHAWLALRSLGVSSGL